MSKLKDINLNDLGIKNDKWNVPKENLTKEQLTKFKKLLELLEDNLASEKLKESLIRSQFSLSFKLNKWIIKK